MKLLLELIIEFNKLAEYEINIYNSGSLVYTNSKSSEIEIKKAVQFRTTTKIA
jgi:hypothetical protein